MPYFRECPKCGCHLDPGEVCDCGDLKAPVKKDGPCEAKSIRLTYKAPAVLKVKGPPKPPCPFK